MPASFGVQGPGESTIASGSSAIVSSRCARHCAGRDLRAQFTEKVDEVERETIVVVDQRDALHPGSRAPEVSRLFRCEQRPSSRAGQCCG